MRSVSRLARMRQDLAEDERRAMDQYRDPPAGRRSKTKEKDEEVEQDGEDEDESGKGRASSGAEGQRR